MSGSSSAGYAAAKSSGATPVIYPRPVGIETDSIPLKRGRCGARVGIIARDRSADAWHIAHERFPANRRGEIAHLLATRVSDSVWHKQLDAIHQESGSNELYWLHPYSTYQTFCPYLVGSYDEVAAEIARYVESGFRTFILDIPRSREDLVHAGVVFRKALEIVRLTDQPVQEHTSDDHSGS